MTAIVKYFAHYVKHICKLCQLIFMENVEPLKFCFLGCTENKMATLINTFSSIYQVYIDFFFLTANGLQKEQMCQKIGSDK